MIDVKAQISQEIENNKVVLFMKGTKEMPMCGFSNLVCHILNSLNVEYKAINVLSSEELRSGIKEYSNWPTIPQLYINKEFIGGSDIVKQLYEAGELQKLLI